MRILIVGANGFLGRKATDLLSKEHEIIATSKISSEGNPQLDITKRGDVLAAIEKYNPSLVFNCAGFVDVEGSERDKTLSWDVNASGPVYLADVCMKRGIKLIIISSDYVFSGDNSPYKESTEAHPKSFYGFVKSMMERAVSNINPEAIIIRPSILYGFNPHENQDKLVIPTLDALRAGKRIVVTDMRPKYPVLLEDLINNAMILYERGEKGIFHFASSLTNRYEVARVVAKTFGLDETLVKRGEPIEEFGIKPYDVHLLNTRAPYLNFVSFEEGVKIIKGQMGD